jgi:hypothetical protein
MRIPKHPKYIGLTIHGAVFIYAIWTNHYMEVIWISSSAIWFYEGKTALAALNSTLVYLDDMLHALHGGYEPPHDTDVNQTQDGPDFDHQEEADHELQ